MAARRSIFSLCREILRKIKETESQFASKDATWSYLKRFMRERKGVPAGLYDRGREERTLAAFLQYITSSAIHRDLIQQYQKKGERSVEESAHLVGLKLPQEKN
uniref:Protein FMC1 homolog n=1 Tax=Amphimedon queenslandica TaxID=400682 RepID=A0A1X7U3Y6_AMPQE